MAFGVEVPLIFREGSGVAALACCRAAPDSLLLLTNFLCYNVISKIRQDNGKTSARILETREKPAAAMIESGR